ncbi:MAG: phosphatidate cytidylyltransferase, partial [Acidimicrobiia bacterium]
LVGYMSAQGIREYSKLVRLELGYRWTLLIYGVFGLLVTGYFGDRFFLFMPLGFFGVASLIPLLRLRNPQREVKAEVLQLAAAILGYIWIPFFLSFFVLIGRAEPGAVGLLLLLGFGVALSDVLAFTVGKAFGGPKLLTNVSPNKTWAGVAGNFIGAYLAFMLMGFAIPQDWSNVTAAILPAVVALGAIWGDLVESLAKRGFGVKDAGDLLPGFGGLLDRIDSLLLAMPLSYYAMKVLQYFTT